jgi:RNA polymerase sigma-70 factor (ECF subfamily)
MADFGDHEFLKAFTEGDNPAFGRIYKHYYPGLYSTCLKYIRPKGSEEDAKDLVSITFQKLYQRRGKIDTMPGITRFLHLALRTASIDFLRRKRAVKETPHDPLALVAVNDEIDVEFWENVMKEKKVMEMLEKLPERSKEVIELFYLKGLKYRQIGDQMNISTKTVENQLRYALDKLRNALTDKRMSSVLLLAVSATAGVISELVVVVFVLHISGMLSQL